MILIELGFFQGDGSSPASSPELQRESTHLEKIRQSFSQLKKSTHKKYKEAPPADEDKHDIKKKIEDELKRLLEPDVTPHVDKHTIISLISEDTKK